MITPVDLIKTLAQEFRIVLKDFNLEAEYQENKNITVYEQALPLPQFEDDTFFPYAVVSVEKVIDDDDFESYVVVVVSIGVYGGDDEGGWQDLFNIAERLRQYLMLNSVVCDKFVRVLPCEFTFEGAADERGARPFYLGDIALLYKISTPVQVVGDSF